MVQVNFLNNNSLVTIPVYRIVTNHSTNSVYLYFNTDDQARMNENQLKTAGYKTEHTDKTIRVFNFNDFDILIPE